MENEENPESECDVFDNVSFKHVWELEDIAEVEKADNDIKVLDNDTSRDNLLRLGDSHKCGCELTKRQAIILISTGFFGILAIFFLIFLGALLARRNGILCCTPTTLDSGGPESLNYNITFEWQAMNHKGNRSWYNKWSSKIYNATVGQPVHTSEGEVIVLIHHIYDDKDAWVSVSASVMCCTNEWIVMDKLDDVDSFGEWSSVGNCVCEHVWFDSQVRVAVTPNNF